MKGNEHIFLVFLLAEVQAQDVGILSELPFAELLAQRKVVEGRNLTEVAPVALALASPPLEREVGLKGPRKTPQRKTFHDYDYEDGKEHLHKEEKEHKIHDVLNTSIMVLSYLAFGGYLLCMIANVLREKRRRIMMTYPSAVSSANNQFSSVLQHYMSHRPVRPFTRFPTVSLHPGRKKRRKR